MFKSLVSPTKKETKFDQVLKTYNVLLYSFDIYKFYANCRSRVQSLNTLAKNVHQTLTMISFIIYPCYKYFFLSLLQTKLSEKTANTFFYVLYSSVLDLKSVIYSSELWGRGTAPLPPPLCIRSWFKLSNCKDIGILKS